MSEDSVYKLTIRPMPLRKRLHFVRLIMVAILTFCFTRPVSSTAAPLADQWQELNPLIGHTMVNIGGAAYLFGGAIESGSPPSSIPINESVPINESGAVNGLWKWNIPDNWQQITPANAPPPARYDHAATVVGNNMYVIGGWGDGSPLSDIWAYDPTSNTWTQPSPGGINAPSERYAFRAVTIDALIYIFGGRTRSGLDANLWAFNPTNATWEHKSSGPSARMYYSAANINGRLVIFGGSSLSGYLNDLWIYNPQTNQWANIPLTGGLPATASQATATWGNEMWLFGGVHQGGTIIGEVWQVLFDANMTSAQAVRQPDLPLPRTGAAAVALSPISPAARFLIFGGWRGTKPMAETFIYLTGYQIYLPLILCNAIGN